MASLVEQPRSLGADQHGPLGEMDQARQLLRFLSIELQRLAFPVELFKAGRRFFGNPQPGSPPESLVIEDGEPLHGFREVRAQLLRSLRREIRRQSDNLGFDASMRLGRSLLDPLVHGTGELDSDCVRRSHRENHTAIPLSFLLLCFRSDVPGRTTFS